MWHSKVRGTCTDDATPCRRRGVLVALPGYCSVLIVLPLVIFLLPSKSVGDTEGVSRERPSAALASRDFVAELESGTAFKESNPEIRNALLTLMQAASTFKEFDKHAIETSPGTVVERRASEHSLTVVKRSPNGRETTYVYDIGDERLSIVKMVAEDGGKLGITFTKFYNPDAIGIHSAWLSDSNTNIEFSFYPATVQPKRAFIFDKSTESGVRVGRIVAWSEAGAEITRLVIPGARNPFELTQGLLSMLNEREMEALDIAPSLRLTSRSAFQALDADFKRPMQALVVYSEKLIGSSPGELQTALMGDAQEQSEHDNVMVYRISSHAEPEWVVRYDGATTELRSASFGNLNLFFDFQETSRLTGGYEEIGSKNGKEEKEASYRLMGLYPGRFLPRVTLAAQGQSVFTAHLTGALKLWSPDGKLVLDMAPDEPVSVIKALEAVQERLTVAQKDGLEWAGARREAARLVGKASTDQEGY